MLAFLELNGYELLQTDDEIAVARRSPLPLKS
jgi:hypothetical protein